MDSLEIAKAVGITAVVTGHANGESWIGSAIYAFHMPFYFILSGSLFRAKQPPIPYFKRKASHLLIPYFMYLLLNNYASISGFSANLILGSMTAEKLGFYSDLFFRQLVGGQNLKGVTAALWFPTCLFFTQQISNIILTLRAWITRAIIIIIYISGYINQHLFPDFWLPMGLNVTAAAIPFFCCGRWIKNQFGSGLSIALIIAFMLYCISIPWIGTDASYDMKYSNYGIPIISSLVAAGGYFFVFYTARFLNIGRLGEAISRIGKASMTM